MKQRRSLAEGIKPETEAARTARDAFVFAAKPTAKPSPTTADPISSEAGEGKQQAAKAVSRVPLTMRVRADFALALKRASLQRQLDNVFPNTLQDILEEALQPWLAANGYLK